MRDGRNGEAAEPKGTWRTGNAMALSDDGEARRDSCVKLAGKAIRRRPAWS